MRKTFSVFRLAPYALCALSLFGLQAYGQDRDNDKDRTNDHPNGIVQDWSRRHAVYPRFGPIHSLIAAQHDPRALQSWQAAAREDWHRARRWRHPHDRESSFHPDWSIGLGTGGMAPSMYPAKFTFDTNATPNCVVGAGVTIPDFVVYSVNVTGSVSQPNIVAFNNLYSGTAGSAGICNRTPTGNDDGVSATTMWSYAINPGGGIVATSPTLSLDGTKVAFVETGSGFNARFHVLAWANGDGVVANLQTVTSPKVIDTNFATQAPVAGSGTVTNLILGSGTSGTGGDTLSSPFIEYNSDMAYVGNNVGVLFRIKDVFCTINPACAGATPPVPSLDATWGTGGALATGCSGVLTGPVVGGSTGNIFVGCSDGNLYGFTSAGVPLANSPLTIGDGSATGGIVDPPLVDEINGFVYAVSGSSSGGNAVLVQASTTDLSLQSTAILGAGGNFNLHAPAFNDAYYSSGVSSNWLLYEYSANIGAGTISIYAAGFNGSHVMNSGTPSNVHNYSIGAFEISPLTEFLNGAEDRLFAGAIGTLSGNFVSWNITSGFPASIENSITEGSGTTGVVVDNVSGSAQASSVYFGVLGSNTAVKLTQSGLQ